jgi:hypothetical protein
MTPNYTYISSSDFIDNLTFDYVDTYSFQRGIDYDENLKKIRQEYDNLKISKQKQTNLTPIQEERLNELNELLGFTQYLLTADGQFHPSSKKLNTFKLDDPIIDRLKLILKTEIINIPGWMCAPHYRDAIVFYDKNNKIITNLNVCLSCQYMETSRFNHVNGDFKTYDLLKKFFIDIGHDVEDSDYFVWDSLQKRQNKK